MIRVFLALAVLVAGTARADTLADVQQRGELRWGGDIQGGEPYVFEDPAQPGKLVGFEVEIADAIARRLKVKATFIQVAWSNLVPALERGDFDVAMNGLEATPERQHKLRLSRPYYVYSETLAVRRGSPIRWFDLEGKKVGTLNQTYAFDLLRARGIEPVLYEGVQEPYLDLVAARLDAVLLDNIIAERYGCVLPAVLCLPGEGALGAYVIGLRKDDGALGGAIDAALEDMKQSGEMRRILDKWKLWNGLQEGPAPLAAIAPAERQKRAFDGAQLVLFLRGAVVTLALSAVAFFLAVVLGMLLAVTRVFGNRFAAAAAAIYVEIFRGTPVLLQLYVLYFALAPVLRLGAFEAAILGLGLNYAAYEAEIYRGALLALPRGQTEAAHSLGMSRWHTLRFVLVPQALRMALPAMTNDFVALLKDSSVVSVITVVELTKRMTIAAVDLNDWIVPGVACAALYFAMSFPLAHLARVMEKRLHRDTHSRTT